MFDFIRKQFVDVIEWLEQPGELAWRVPFADREIQHGAQLTVREGQVAAFVNEGRVADYFGRVHDELCLLVQLETRAALQRLEAIAAVDGIDGIFIGPSDLSADLGHLGNPGHPDVQAAIRAGVETCRRLGKAAGILAPVEEDARRYLDWGFTFVAVGADMGLLRKAADELIRRFRT